MRERETRRLIRDLLQALHRALPAVRDADRAYQKLMRQASARRPAPAKGGAGQRRRPSPPAAEVEAGHAR
jgi:hypothetical protein